MVREGSQERRSAARPVSQERRGGLWLLPDGSRLPSALDNPKLALGDPEHPARLQPEDLKHPQTFHQRLKEWLLRQG